MCPGDLVKNTLVFVEIWRIQYSNGYRPVCQWSPLCYAVLSCPHVCFLTHLSLHCNSQVLVSEVIPPYSPPHPSSFLWHRLFHLLPLHLSKSLFQMVSRRSGFCSSVVQLRASLPAVSYHPLQLCVLSR